MKKLSLAALVASTLMVATPLTFAQAAGDGGPQVGSEAGAKVSGKTNKGTMSSTTMGAEVGSGLNTPPKERQVGNVEGQGTPSGVASADRKSPSLPKDQMGHTMTSGSTHSGKMRNNSQAAMNSGTPSNTGDGGPVMGTANGPSGRAQPSNVSPSTMPKN